MINSTNTIEFTLNREDAAASLQRTQIVPSTKTPTEQMASIIHHHQQQHQQSQQQQSQHQQKQNNSIFLSICSNELSQKNRKSGIVISEKFTPYTKDKKSFEIVVNSNNANNKDKVKVQHLETHTKLQNNQWNCQNFCNLSAAVRESEKPNTMNNSIYNNLNQNESAFTTIKIENDDDDETVPVFHEVEKMNSEQIRNMILPQDPQKKPSDNLIESDRRSSPVCRTEDQENAFRRIEDVHNYSKLNRYSYSNASSNSSIHDEEEEDDDDEDEEEEEEEEDGDDEGDESFETYQYFNRKIEFSKNYANKDIYGNNSLNKISNNNQEIASSMTTMPASSTVTTPTSPLGTDDTATLQVLSGAPDHHARRPMNAFLIFCKRHRAIVKDKYKSFENRAITKILGDWWASLDANDKMCYTNLAQQNKDAFFSANPNFKWYKLPAPPLRTLSTRPSNSERLQDQDDNLAMDTIPFAVQNHNYFKLADVAQMGELSTLMYEKKSNQINQNALQQALGETTQYLNSQIPDLEPTNNKWKRKLYNDNSFSSNSSEEDLLPKKSSRSCKGKIYQELINSGQIAAITKKPKTPKHNNFQANNEHFANDPNVPMHYGQLDSNAGLQRHNVITAGGVVNKSMAIDCNTTPNYELIPFDLEKKIKELPALSLDVYLQRKRSTKKRKKINSKKRNSSYNNKIAVAQKLLLTSPQVTPQKECNPLPPANTAVGSQKRKARKESITRRDISAIENEVAALLPFTENLTAITCNGSNYYYKKSTSPDSTTTPKENTTDELNTIGQEIKKESVEITEFLDNSNNNSSDLLILAEVAAKRTESPN